MDQTIIDQLEKTISDLKKSQSGKPSVDISTLRKIFFKGYNMGVNEVLDELEDSSFEVRETINFNENGFDLDISFESDIDIPHNFVKELGKGIRNPDSYSADSIIKEIIGEDNVSLKEDSERKHQVTKEQINVIVFNMMKGFKTVYVKNHMELYSMIETLVNMFEEVMANVVSYDSELAMDCLIPIDEEYFDGKFTFGVSKKYDYES